MGFRSCYSLFTRTAVETREQQNSILKMLRENNWQLKILQCNNEDEIQVVKTRKKNKTTTTKPKSGGFDGSRKQAF